MTTIDWVALGVGLLVLFLYGGLMFRFIGDYQELQRIRRHRRRR